MQEQRQDPLIEEALRWLVVLKDKAASDGDRQAFDRWLKADPDHAAAWRRAQQVWMRVGKIGPAFERRRKEQTWAAQARLDIVPPPRPVLSAPARPLSAHGVPARAGRRRFLLAAAAVVAVAVPAAVLLSRPGLLADHATAAGERRVVSLADGSTAELAGASSLSVDFAADRRRVVLHEGQAFFTVAPDAARPFIVEAASGRTRALGTAFDVKKSGEGVTVAVVQHSVAVSVDGAEKVIVGEGQQVRYGGGRQVAAVREVDLEQLAAWRHDRLIFNDAPLGDVVADLERYRGGRIVMTDSSLHRLPVTAVLDAHQADAALDRIAGSLPVRVRRLTDLLVILSPAR